MKRPPKKSPAATVALASILGRTSVSASSSVTVTCPTRSRCTAATRPLWTPDTMTGSPSFSPATLVNTTRAVIPWEERDRPVSQNIPTTKTRSPARTSPPTPTSCLYVRSIGALALNERHFQVPLQELLHRRVFRRDDLFGRAHGANLRLPEQRDPVRHPERPADVVRHYHARDPQLLLQALHQPVDHIGVYGVEA